MDQSSVTANFNVAASVGLVFLEETLFQRIFGIELFAWFIGELFRFGPGFAVIPRISIIGEVVPLSANTVLPHEHANQDTGIRIVDNWTTPKAFQFWGVVFCRFEINPCST